MRLQALRVGPLTAGRWRSPIRRRAGQPAKPRRRAEERNGWPTQQRLENLAFERIAELAFAMSIKFRQQFNQDLYDRGMRGSLLFTHSS
jgi:hypothetical protein